MFIEPLLIADVSKGINSNWLIISQIVFLYMGVQIQLSFFFQVLLSKKKLLVNRYCLSFLQPLMQQSHATICICTTLPSNY